MLRPAWYSSVQDLLSWKANAANADEALHRLDAAGMSKARGAAQAALDALMLTDAPLLYSPSLVALAALRAGFRKVHIASVLFSNTNGKPASLVLPFTVTLPPAAVSSAVAIPCTSPAALEVSRSKGFALLSVSVNCTDRGTVRKVLGACNICSADCSC